MQPPDRPLPDCLTRLLGAPAAQVEPTPGDRGWSEPRGRALDGAILRTFVSAVAGVVWAGILWQAVRWMAR